MTDLERKNAWLACPAMTEELRKELDGMDEVSLHDSFYRNLTFGTGGLRGVLRYASVLCRAGRNHQTL